MKIAVYTIALNEEKHVKRWYESAKDADLLVIADTGSTDKTRYVAKAMGISVTEIEVNPWRFDVARNASLALIPEDFDICIQLDMDEILPVGWRKKVEEAFEEGNTWPIYKHVTSRYPDGTPRNYQHYFKIHPRKGFYWKYPIHEVLAHLPELSFNRKVIDLEVDHIKDQDKPRNSYLSLLEMAVEEEPNDWRMNHYLNREYFYNRDWLKVLQSAYQCEEISGGWDIERASTYMWASEAAHHLKMAPLAEEWAKKATTAAPHFYEVWHWRAHIAHLYGKWLECLEFSSKRMELQRQNHHLVKPEVWEWWGYDLIALSNHRLGRNQDAVDFGSLALSANPGNERLKQNLEFYKKALAEDESKNQSTPKVLWAILAKDASKTLPLYLDCLTSQTYSAKSIGLYIRTNDNNDDTEKVLSDFIEKNRDKYLEIYFDSSPIDETLKKYEQHDWNEFRFNIMAKIRQESLEFANANKYDFYFCADTDNFVLPFTLERLISNNLSIVAPMLRMAVPERTSILVENQNNSNFYFTDENLFFRRCEEFYSILNRENPGLHSVPLIHCTYLIKADIFDLIDYNYRPGDWEYKNLVYKLRDLGIELFLDNSVEYGVLTLSAAIPESKFQLKGLAELNKATRGEQNKKQIFDKIYSTNAWGYRSGPGSDPNFAAPFIHLVNKYIEENKVRNILDVGCGDFRLGRNYNLEGIDYLGMDVSSLIINENKSFERSGLQFIQADFENWKSDRVWDLVIIKDVLQHLSNESISKVLAKLKRCCKIALLCNDLGENITDIVNGGYRRLDLKKHPFNLEAAEVINFSGKQVLEFRAEEKRLVTRPTNGQVHMRY